MVPKFSKLFVVSILLLRPLHYISETNIVLFTHKLFSYSISNLSCLLLFRLNVASKPKKKIFHY